MENLPFFSLPPFLCLANLFPKLTPADTGAVGGWSREVTEHGGAVGQGLGGPWASPSPQLRVLRDQCKGRAREPGAGPRTAALARLCPPKSAQRSTLGVVAGGTGEDERHRAGRAMWGRATPLPPLISSSFTAGLQGRHGGSCSLLPLQSQASQVGLKALGAATHCPGFAAS